MKRTCNVLLTLLIAGMLWAQDDRAEVRVEAHAEGGAKVQVRVQVDGVVVQQGGDVGKAKPQDTAATGEAKKDGEKKPEKVDVTVKVTGIAVRKPTEAERERNQTWYGAHSPGTTLSLETHANTGGVIALVAARSKLRTLSDDLGTVLVRLPKENAAKDGVLKPEGTWLRIWRIGGNRGPFSFQIGGPNVPAEGAMTITVNAEILLLWAKEQKTVKVKDVKLKPGTKVKLGLAEMEVTELPAGWGNQQGFGLKYTGDVEVLRPRIVAFRFYKADGSEYPRRGFGSSRSDKQETRYFRIDEKVKQITMELTYWDQTRELKLPVDLTTGLGF